VHADVVVIGAGLAGLAAAREAAAKGLSVIILEARNRIGGRVWTTFGRGQTHPIELGAEWIPDSGDVRNLLESHGATLFHANGGFWVRTARGIEHMDNLEHVTGPILERLRNYAANEKSDISLRDALSRCCKDVAGDDVATLLGYVEGFHAADPAKLSTRWLLEVEESQSADESGIRCDDGNHLICESIARSMGLRVSLYLEHVVTHVAWNHGNVTVRARQADNNVTVNASKVIVTVPLALLKEQDATSTIVFEPPLHEKRRALDTLHVGHALRMTFVFRDPFWLGLDTMPDPLFMQKIDELVPTWWRADPLPAPILVGWVAGPGLQKLDGIRGEELRDVALSSLTAVLGVERARVDAEFLSWHHHDWSADPFARGAYSYVGPEGAAAWKQLSKPMADTVFIAGEAAIGGGLNATMEGAFRSGVNAGRAV